MEEHFFVHAYGCMCSCVREDMSGMLYIHVEIREQPWASVFAFPLDSLRGTIFSSTLYMPGQLAYGLPDLPDLPVGTWIPDTYNAVHHFYVGLRDLASGPHTSFLYQLPIHQPGLPVSSMSLGHTFFIQADTFCHFTR